MNWRYRRNFVDEVWKESSSDGIFLWRLMWKTVGKISNSSQIIWSYEKKVVDMSIVGKCLHIQIISDSFHFDRTCSDFVCFSPWAWCKFPLSFRVFRMKPFPDQLWLKISRVAFIKKNIGFQITVLGKNGSAFWLENEEKWKHDQEKKIEVEVENASSVSLWKSCK